MATSFFCSFILVFFDQTILSQVWLYVSLTVTDVCTVVYNFLQTAIVIESMYFLLYVGCDLIKSIGMNYLELEIVNQCCT